MFDHLIKFTKLTLLILVELAHYQFLSVYTVAHLFFELLESCLHPMTVIFCRFDIALLQLSLNVSPNLAHLEMRVHLNHFQFLLLVCCQVVPCKTDSV